MYTKHRNIGHRTATLISANKHKMDCKLHLTTHERIII